MNTQRKKSNRESSYQSLGPTPFERYSKFQQDCTSCGMPMNSVGTWIGGEKYCKDCVQEGKYAGHLLAERNKLLKQAAKIELELESMGYDEHIQPEYDYYLQQENREELRQVGRRLDK
jgi:hypothetical protein